MLWTHSPFMEEGRSFGNFILEPGKLNMGGFESGSLWSRSHEELSAFAHIFLDKLVEDRDLLSYDYLYSFSFEGSGVQGGGRSGFRVGEYYGHIDARSKPFLTLTLSEVSPSGKGRVVQVIDLRNKEKIKTDDLGYLKRHRRKGKFELIGQLESLLQFLEKNSSETVTISPTWQE